MDHSLSAFGVSRISHAARHMEHPNAPIGIIFGFNPYIIRIGDDDRIYWCDNSAIGAIVACDMLATTNQSVIVLNNGNYAANPNFPTWATTAAMVFNSSMLPAPPQPTLRSGLLTPKIIPIGAFGCSIWRAAWLIRLTPKALRL